MAPNPSLDTGPPALGRRLADGLQRCLVVHPEARDGASTPALATWPLPPAPPGPSAARLAALQSPPGAARDQAQALYQRCLQHYREVLCADGTDPDDLAAALAAFLVASLQALEGHVATNERWHQVRQWLQAWVDVASLNPQADPASSRDTLESLAILAAALGEWSVQASRQGAAAEAATRLMAQRWLQQELGLNAELLLRAMRWAGVVDAGNPSWGRTTLPKHRTGRAGTQRL